MLPREFVWIHKNIVEWGGQDWLYYALGTTRLLSNPVPLRQVYRHGKRPYVMGFCALEAHRLYPGGVGRLTRDIQAEINENANQRTPMSSARQVRHEQALLRQARQART